ncbi:hypothetical protein [Paenibacillus sp. DCT19]|nr:hypothetical protein [Paenibacillus sp. DCT19]
MRRSWKSTTKNCLEFALFALGFYASTLGFVWAALLWMLLYFLHKKL